MLLLKTKEISGVVFLTPSCLSSFSPDLETVIAVFFDCVPFVKNKENRDKELDILAPP